MDFYYKKFIYATNLQHYCKGKSMLRLPASEDPARTMELLPFAANDLNERTNELEDYFKDEGKLAVITKKSGLYWHGDFLLGNIPERLEAFIQRNPQQPVAIALCDTEAPYAPYYVDLTDYPLPVKVATQTPKQQVAFSSPFNVIKYI